MIIPALYRRLRPWLFLAVGLPLWLAAVLVTGCVILMMPRRDSEGDPLNLEDLDA